jgi:hypothetical protein
MSEPVFTAKAPTKTCVSSEVMVHALRNVDLEIVVISGHFKDVSLDHVVRQHENGGRNRHSKRACSLEIDGLFEFGRQLDWHVGGLPSLQNQIDLHIGGEVGVGSSVIAPIPADRPSQRHAKIA